MKFYKPIKGYHASHLKHWEPEKHRKSRYGFQAIFLSTDIDHCKLYKRSVQKTYGEAYIHECMIPEHVFMYQVDFKGKFTYTPHFRNLIRDLKKAGHGVVKIKNVIDYPSKEFMQIRVTDLIVVYEINLVQFLKDLSSYD